MPNTISARKQPHTTVWMFYLSLVGVGITWGPVGSSSSSDSILFLLLGGGWALARDTALSLLPAFFFFFFFFFLFGMAPDAVVWSQPIENKNHDHGAHVAQAAQ